MLAGTILQRWTPICRYIHRDRQIAFVAPFLQTLGVTILSATRVRLEGKNPFPWPVTLRFRGLTVKRGADSTEVTFHNGKSVTVTDSKPCVVAM